jgi:hypothetical protein
MIPTPNCLLIPTVCTKSYFYDSSAFENLLKTKDENGFLKYDFAIDDIEKISTTNYFNLFSFPSVASTEANFNIISNTTLNPEDYRIYSINSAVGSLTKFYGVGFEEKMYNYQRCTLFNELNTKAATYSKEKFMIATFDYYSPSRTNLEVDHTVAAVINELIPFEEIFENWNLTKRWIEKSSPGIKVLIDTNKYSFINKYIIQPFLQNCTTTSNTSYAYIYAMITAADSKPAIGYLFLLSLNFDFLYSTISFWKTGKRGQKFTLDSLESLLSEYGYQSNIFTSYSNGYGQVSETDIVSTNRLETALKKLNINLIGGNDLYSFLVISIRDYVPWYTREESLANKNFYNITSGKISVVGTETIILSDTNKITTRLYNSPYTVFYYDANVVYLKDKTKNNIGLQLSLYNLGNPQGSSELGFYTTASEAMIYNREVVIKYTLLPKSQINNTANTLASSAAYGTVKDGKLVAATAASNFSKSVQSLAAGAKMPAVVSLKVETGYEGQEQEQKFNTDEYFAYQYDIYGLASEQALIDIGRISQDYVYSKKINSDTGGYFQNIKNQYYYGNKLYLFKVTYKRNGITTTYNYFDNAFKNLGVLAPASSKADFIANATFNITVLNGGNPNTSIGLRQTIDGVFGGITPAAADKLDTFDELSYFWKTNDNFYSLGASELTRFFTNSYKTLVFSAALPFLKRVSNSKSLVSVDSYPSDAYVAVSPISGNSDGYDRYELYVDNNNYLSIDVYPYNYTIYNSIDTSTGLVIPINTSVLSKNYIESNLYLTLYYEPKVANVDFCASLMNSFPEDLIYILSRTKEYTIIARFSRNQEAKNSTIIDKINAIANSLKVGFVFAGNLAEVAKNLFKF